MRRLPEWQQLRVETSGFDCSLHLSQVEISCVTEGFYVRTGKRCFDLTVGTFTFVLLLIPQLIAAVLVLVFLGRPVLFRQQRSGRQGLSFTLLKFRSMNDRRDAADKLLPDSIRLQAVYMLLDGGILNLLHAEVADPATARMDLAGLAAAEQCRGVRLTERHAALLGLASAELHDHEGYCLRMMARPLCTPVPEMDFNLLLCNIF